VIGTFWCIAIGWAAAEARTWPQRCLVAAAAALGTWGYFPDEPARFAVVALGMICLLVPWSVHLPRILSRPLHLLAAASLWIYLTHWQVYPGLEAAGHPVAAVLASVAIGLLAHRAHRCLLDRIRRR